MRIETDIVRSGYFWLPDTPETRVPGTLTIRDGGEPELEILGNFDSSPKHYDGSFSVPMIVGLIETERMVTLVDCHYRYKSTSFGAVSKSRLFANFAIFGAAYDEGEALTFNSFQFGVEGLEEWINISGIKVSVIPDLMTADISYKRPADREVTLEAGLVLKVRFDATLNSPRNLEGTRIRERTFFTLVAQEDVPLSKFLSTAKKLVNFICLAVDATVGISEVWVTNSNLIQSTEAGKSRPIPLRLYYSSLPHTESVPSIQRFNYLFDFADIADVLEDCLRKWLSAYEDIGPSLNLYFSTKQGGSTYLEPKFLALAQAIETLHRRTYAESKLMPKAEFKTLLKTLIDNCPEEWKQWANDRLSQGNELALAARLEAIASPYSELLGGAERTEKFVTATRNTRNYLTHYDQKLASKAAKGRDLWGLVAHMEILLELNFLRRIGLVEYEIAKSSSAANGLSRKIKHLLEFQEQIDTKKN